ncbi:hypothetical protein COO60DRAFT_430002 [Scenedesmus sp. NREL 46B-D3]|nr:hypothetical protein COO60DRAFT_430002 [Scenedesmus sp. NREL 46B-D3]
MAGSDTNVRRPPAMYYNSDSSIYDDVDSSVCGVVYITSEGGAYQPKPSQNKVLQQQSEPHARIRQAKRSSKRLLLWVACAVGVVLLLALGIGIAVGVAKQRQAQQSQEQQQQQQGQVPPQLPGANATGAMEMRLPFRVSAEVEPPAGTVKAYTCDMLFSTDQALQAFTSSLQTALTAQLLPLDIDSINVTQLSCNGDSYRLTRPAQWDAWPGTAVGRRRLLQQLSVAVSSSSSSSSMQGPLQTLGSLELSVVLEIRRHEYVSDVRSAAEWGGWIGQTRRAAAAASVVILPKLLGDLVKVTVVSDSLLVTQLPTVQVTSRAAASGVNGQLEVTHTTLDPSTGAVLRTQVMVATAPGAADDDDSRSSSSSGSGDAAAGGGAGDVGSDAAAKDSTAASDRPGPSSSSSSTSTGKPSAPPAKDAVTDDEDDACGTCSLKNAVAGCVRGSCAVAHCLPGWQDCDGLAATGCEADVLTFFSNSAHCGGCGKICLAPLTCSKGRCELPQSAGDPSTAAPPPDTAVPRPPAAAAAEQREEPAAAQPPAADGPDEQPPAPAPVMAGDAADAAAAAAEPPAAAAPQSPAVAVPQPPALPAVVPAAPAAEGTLTLYDDVTRVTPTQQTLTLDVLKNDNLGRTYPADVSITIIAPGPAAGSAVVLPATVAGNSSSDGSGYSRQQIQLSMGAAPLLPGQSETFFYSVDVPGQPAPAPAAVTVIGAASSPNPGLLDCSPATIETTGTILIGRADDQAQAVALPFAVSLYGSSYSTATISSNGWVSLGDSGATEVCNVKTSWPNGSCLGSGPVLAVFWDDLLPDAVLTHHNKQLGVFVIQWTNVMVPSNPMLLGTFQAYLFQNGSIAYVYRDMFGSEQGLGGSAIIGVRGPSKNSQPFNSQLESSQLKAVGATDDPTAPGCSRYTMTTQTMSSLSQLRTAM